MSYELFLFVILSIAKDLFAFRMHLLALFRSFASLRMTNKKLSVTPCTLW